MIKLFRVATLMFACAASLNAACGQFSVNPVRVELTPDNAIAVLNIVNQGKETLTLQTRTAAWDQNTGGDEFSPTREVLATPPLFSLAPGAEQVVRVGLRRPFEPQRELTYRLFFEEVLPPPSPDFRGVRMALNVSLPVFAGSLDTFKSQVGWRLENSPEGMVLHAQNLGSTHLQARSLTLTPLVGGAPVFAQDGNFYVLPMKERTWPIKLAPSPGVYLLEAETDAGKLRLELVSEPAAKK
jgi:fimbrial chaperone protein